MAAAAAVSFLRVHDPETAPRGLRLKQLCREYCLSRPQISDDAREQYRVGARLFRRWWLLSQRQVRQALSPEKRPGLHPTCCCDMFTLAHVLEYAGWLAREILPNGRPRSAATINGRLDTVRMFWELAAEEEHAGPLPPAKKWPRFREPRKDPVAWTMAQAMDVIGACLRAPPMRCCKWWAPNHWTTFVGCLLATGQRFDAMLHCPRSALVGNVLTVPAELTKGLKERPVTLEDWLAEKMRALPRIDDSDLFWPYPHDPDQLRVRYTEDILRPAGLPETRCHKFHCLRRTSITQVKIKDGLEKARDHADHSGAAMTIKSYISQSVVEQQTGSVSFKMPAPAPTRQMRLF